MRSPLRSIVVVNEDEAEYGPLPAHIFSRTWYRDLADCFSQCFTDFSRIDGVVIFVDDKRIRSLNATYRGIERVTDVLSFAYEDGDKVSSGEIYISLSQAMRQRHRFHTKRDQEVARLFFHGLLHILGFDHQRSEERKRMRALEQCLMLESRSRHIW